MGTFILAMLLNPEVQKKAQAEIDSVRFFDGGMSRLSLFPHRVAVDDEYQGYRIPANSIVIGNAWAILHDDAIYPDPHSFKPERFLLSGGKLNPAIRDPETVAFGICPGRHMAVASLWIVVASILSTFNIDKAIGEDGREIEPTHEVSPGMISTLLPFKCSITPWSPQAVEMISMSMSFSVLFHSYAPSTPYPPLHVSPLVPESKLLRAMAEF
ncbi:Cytochrome P450 [Mycena sanguinolenta]|uniref:Cytochrome P450 n=1 Tax=Mycena sanguinolenta TaxID=230812 RepID=A0A8H6WZ45_9AGAR|nr:Cytochrome P450 [Mycena sanguinolenta]